MSYLAILGRQPELGLVELECRVGTPLQAFGAYAAILEANLDIHQLGGTVKLGRVIYRGPLRDLNEAPWPLTALPAVQGKLQFGLSYYGFRASSKFVLAAGLTLKKRLRQQGSARLVAPQEGTALNAAQVTFNGLLRQGFELLVVSAGQEMIIALTEQVQDIEAYAARDYARPSRSARVGMLPPKLAQIMINTTSAPLVYDPFCGTGVVLQEALLQGRRAGGSDVSEAMVAATRQNLDWLRQRLPHLPTGSEVRVADATTLQLPSSPVAIVSEGYLGPHLTTPPLAQELTRLQEEIRELYSASLRQWALQLASGSELTLAAPVWRTAQGWRDSGIIDRLSGLGYTLRSFATADSRQLVYRRPQQLVGRQLLVMRKI